MSAENIKKILIEGYAKKEGGNIKSWKKRYFRFHSDGVISYYKDHTDAKALGTIDVTLCSGIALVKNQPLTAFVLLTGTSRNYKINCSSPEDKAAWIAAIETKLPSVHVPEATVTAEEVKAEVETEEVKAEEVIEEVKTEEVKTEEVKTEEVKAEVETEEVKTEEVKAEVETEEVKAEKVKAEEVETEEVKTEEVKAEEVQQIKTEPEESSTTANEKATTTAFIALGVDNAKVSRVGWLMKSGGGKISTAFQRRYIEIYETNLVYFKSQKVGSKSSGAVDLSSALFLALGEEDASNFNVGVQGRTYNFKAESAESAIDWLEHLNKFVEEGARYDLTDARAKLAAEEAAEEVAEEAADKDELIAQLRKRVVELEAQVAELTAPKVVTEEAAPAVAVASKTAVDEEKAVEEEVTTGA